MPLYDYKCSGCGHAFEASHAMDAKPVTECPKCGDSKVRKLFSTGGVLGSQTSGGGSGGPPPSMCGSGMCGSGMCGMG